MEQILTALLDMVSSLVVLVDPSGRIATFNKACEVLTGYHRDEVLGQDLMALFVPEAWAGRVQARFADPFAPEIALPHENPWLTKSGEERMIQWRCTALNIDGSDLPYVLGIGTDVTEWRRAEQEQRRQSRLLELFFESELTCAVLLDKDFNYIRVNHAYARACQRDVAEFTGRNHFELYPSEAQAIFEEVVRSKRPFVVTARPFVFPDHPEWGVTYWDWTLEPVLDKSGEVELLLFCLHDVTERRLTELRLQETLASLRDLSKRTVEIQEQERHRLARELHDDIGQKLTGLKLALELRNGGPPSIASERLHEARTVIDNLLRSVRTISYDLRPPMLDDLGLLSALLWLFDRLQQQSGIEIHFRHDLAAERLPPDIETAVFRIIQESLTNVLRHAGVAEAWASIRDANGTFIIRIEDKGRGFDPSQVHQSGHGAGILGMRERARLLGGRLTVDSVPGNGTRITVELPGSQAVPAPSEAP